MANFLKYLHQNLAHAQFPDFCETYFISFNFSIEENEKRVFNVLLFHQHNGQKVFQTGRTLTGIIAY